MNLSSRIMVQFSSDLSFQFNPHYTVLYMVYIFKPFSSFLWVHAALSAVGVSSLDPRQIRRIGRLAGVSLDYTGLVRVATDKVDDTTLQLPRECYHIN